VAILCSSCAKGDFDSVQRPGLERFTWSQRWSIDPAPSGRERPEGKLNRSVQRKGSDSSRLIAMASSLLRSSDESSIAPEAESSDSFGLRGAAGDRGGGTRGLYSPANGGGLATARSSGIMSSESDAVYSPETAASSIDPLDASMAARVRSGQPSSSVGEHWEGAVALKWTGAARRTKRTSRHSSIEHKADRVPLSASAVPRHATATATTTARHRVRSSGSGGHGPAG